MTLPDSAQQDGETLQDWLKRRNKAAQAGIEAREEEERLRLEEEAKESEKIPTLLGVPVEAIIEEGSKLTPFDKINAAIKEVPLLQPPGGGDEEEAPVEETTINRIRVPEGFEVTRFVYGPDGEPTAVYIDRKSSPFTGDKLPAFIAGTLTGIFFMMAVRYLLSPILAMLLGSIGGL